MVKYFAKDGFVDYDVIIVGAGPSGSSCAVFLGRRGVKTLLLDKASFPREKTCGDGITGKAVRIVKELEMGGRIESAQHQNIAGLTVSSPSGAVLDIKTTEADKMMYVSKRVIFDNIMFQEAKKNCNALENFEVTGLIIENGKVAGVKGSDKGGKEMVFGANVVVGADGANSLVARKLGLGRFETDKSMVSVRAYYEGVETTSDHIEFHFLKELLPGYFWIFPSGNNEANVGICVIAGDVAKRKLNLKDKLEGIVGDSRFSPRFKNAKRISEIKGWNLPTGAQKRRRAGDGFLLVGDAASLIDPFTGEGIGNALTSGKLAADVICDAVKRGDFSYNALGVYEDKIDDAFGDGFKTSRNLQRFSSNAILFNAMAEELSRNEKMMNLAMSSFIDQRKNRYTFGLPVRLYARVALRFFVDYLKSKLPAKKLTQVGGKSHAL